MKRWQRNLIWFGYGVVIASACELTDYFISHGLLGTWHVLFIELLFLNIGWFGALLEIKLSKKKKRG